MTEPAVKGKTLIVTTTNGTKALLAAQGAAAVYVAAAANLTPAGECARQVLEGHRDILILCAGREAAFGLDDAYCAGRLAVAALGGRKPRRGLNDAALASLDLVRRYGENWQRPLSYSRAGRELARLGFRDDVLDAARMDAYPVLPQFHDRRVTLTPASPAQPHAAAQTPFQPRPQPQPS
jgi:2-phosphosulfolactate phosphatase